MSGTDDEVQLGTGKSPEGAKVAYFEIDRPASIGAKGAQGFVIEVRGEDGKRITHSDSLAGLQKAGYTMTPAGSTPKTPVVAPVVTPVA